MNQVSIPVMKEKLANAYRILNTSSADEIDKKNAYAEVIKLGKEIQTYEKDFSLDLEALKKFDKYATEKVVPKVVWKSDEETLGTLEQTYYNYVKLALNIVRKRLPHESDQSDKFGTIVNATIANLIQADLIMNKND